MRLLTKSMWLCNNSAWLKCQIWRTVSTACHSGEAFLALQRVKLKIVPPHRLCQSTWGPGDDFAGWICLFIWGSKNPDMVNVCDWAGLDPHWFQMMSPVEDGSDSTMAGSDNASTLFISCQLRKTVKSVLSQNWQNFKLPRNNVWWHVLAIHRLVWNVVFLLAWRCIYRCFPVTLLLLSVWQILVVRWEFKVMQIRDGMDFFELKFSDIIIWMLQIWI